MQSEFGQTSPQHDPMPFGCDPCTSRVDPRVPGGITEAGAAGNPLTLQKYFEGKGEPFEIDWISHARWVKSGRFFTASGVSAGMDMACAYIDEVAGEAGGQEARAYAEYT